MKTATTWRAGAIGAVLSLVAVGLVPSAAVGAEEAPGGNVASVTTSSGDTTEHATLAAAVDSAPTDSTITVLEDHVLDAPLVFDNGRTLTLDMNGKTVKFAGTNELQAQGVHLTIVGPGGFEAINAYSDIGFRLRGSVDAVKDYTVVNFGAGVEISALAAVFMTNTNVSGIVHNNGMVANIDGAVLHGYHQAVFVNGSVTPDNTDVLPIVNIANATITADAAEDSHGVYLAGSAVTTVTDSTIAGGGEGPGIALRAGSLELTNTAVTSGDGTPSVASNPNGSTASNIAMVVAQHTTASPISLKINSGTFKGGAAVYIANPEGNADFSDHVQAEIVGGEFVGEMISENSAGAPVAEFISGGTFQGEHLVPEHVNPDMASLVHDSIYGPVTILTPAQARAGAAASVLYDGVETFYKIAESAADVVRYLGGELTLIHTVTFDYNDGEGSAVEKVDAGAKVAKPANPTRAGYSFTGWNVGNSAYDFNSAVNADITLKAQWKKDTPVVPDPKPVTPVNLVDVSSNKNSKNYTQFHSQIQWMANEGITRGWNVGGGKHEFRPKDEITREAMAAFMYRAAGSPKVTLPKQSPFADVTPQNTNFYKEIVWMNQEGISKGWNVSKGKNEFRPKDNITRDAMAAFMYRFAGQPSTKAPAVSPFADVTPKTQFYKEIAWLSDAKISTGWTQVKGKPEYRPYDEISREAMAAFLYRLDRL